MKRVFPIFFLFFLIFMALFSGSPLALSGALRTEVMKDKKITGMYTVILYGGTHGNDIETVAFLDRDGDDYTFEPYAPDFRYKVMKAVSSSEALRHAEPFIGWHRSFNGIRMSRIVSHGGEVIGYELRPLYNPIDFGHMDVMYVDYRLKGNKVIAYIRLKPGVEKALEGGGDGGFRFGK